MLPHTAFVQELSSALDRMSTVHLYSA